MRGQRQRNAQASPTTASAASRCQPVRAFHRASPPAPKPLRTWPTTIDSPTPAAKPCVTETGRNRATEASDLQKQKENHANRNTNGTGPFMLKSRDVDTRTVLNAYAGWWDKPKHNLGEVTFMPIKSDATRTSALISGNIDASVSVPLQDVPRLQSSGVEVVQEAVWEKLLEEEAANLIRFQQSYAASAQIVNTAKTIFDTLLSSVR